MTCDCLLTQGSGITITGSGQPDDPFIISSTTDLSGYDTIAGRTAAMDSEVAARNDAIAVSRLNRLRPAAALVETFQRQDANGANQNVLTSGTLHLAAIDLPSGLLVANLSFISGTTAAASPTNWWFALYDNNRVQLATTANQLTAAWAANTLKTLAVANTAAGAAASFTTTYAGLHYIGIMMTAATPPFLHGLGIVAPITGLVPILDGNSTTGMTTPPAFPSTAAAITAGVVRPYAYVG